ncbi:MAG: DNA polymerase Y family protein [Deltaproteobacteria bacterium]
MGRIILHLDMDAFFASIEQAINPALRGRPVIVGSRRKKYYTVVAACSYEAKACGIESGMLSVDAFALCPTAAFVPCDSARYMYTSDRIEQMLKGYADRMERASIDEFFLDMTGSGSLADAELAAKEIKSWIRRELGITGSVGIAPSRTISKMAAKARKPDGLLVVGAGEVEDFLRPLPVEKVPGIGPHMKRYLNEMCVYTLGELAAVPVERLAERFGKNGVWMHQVIRGIGDDEVACWRDPAPPPKSVGHSYTLERELSRPQDIEAWIRLLCEMVGARLRSYGLESRVAHLYLRGAEGFYSREKTFADPTDDPEEIWKRAVAIFRGFPQRGLRVRGLGVSVSVLSQTQDNRLFETDRKRRRLLSAVDTINDRFGDWSICPAVIKNIKAKA